MLKLNYGSTIKITKNSGFTSNSFTAPDTFIKYIIKYQKYTVYQREKYLASILGKFDWFPRLLYADDEKQYFIYKNVGVPVNKETESKDLKKQFDKILADMKSVNVQHNDIKIGELLINTNGKIFLCDFGWGSLNNDLGCGVKNIWSCNNKNKPGGWFDDENTLKRLGLI